MITRPLLAVAVEGDKIKFPVLVTPKLDGIRCLKVDGKVVSRNFKPIPNHHIRGILERILPDGMDGEIMVPGVDFNSVQSAVMSRDGEPHFEYFAFDYVAASLDTPYSTRMDNLVTFMKSLQPGTDDLAIKHIRGVIPRNVETLEQLLSFEREVLDDGFEGLMLRDPFGKYKCGRSTVKEGTLLKFKRFQDAEALVIGFEEKLMNTNTQEEDAFGLAKRSSKKEGLVGADTLGALMVKDPETNIEFGIGSGFDDKLRREIWANRDKYLNSLVTYKFQPSGMKEAPRFPVFKGFRSENDLSA